MKDNNKVQRSHFRKPGSGSKRELAPIRARRGALRNRVRFPDGQRNRGLHLVGASGSGKSLAMGYLAYLDLLRGTPQIILDPMGQAIDALLLRVSQLPKSERRRLWPRIRYIDMSGRTDRPPRWPLLFELPGDSLYSIADRFLETCVAIDSQLETAPLLGANALFRVGQPVGTILAALGLQLDEAPHLLDRPEEWLSRLDQARRVRPDAGDAIDRFTSDYMGGLGPGERLTVSQSYRAKLMPVVLDPALRPILCSGPPSVDFYDVVDRQQTILVDFRGVRPGAKTLLTRWVYDCLMAFVEHRGPGLHMPLAVHIDEIVDLADRGTLGADRFARDLDRLLNIVMRNSNLWVTAAHQQMFQVGERSRETLLSMGTQMIGQVSDLETAELLARRFAGQIDPFRPKRMHKVWMQDPFGIPYVIEQEPVDFRLEEQAFLAARAFLALKPFQFYIKPRTEARVHRGTLADEMGPPWPNESGELLAYIRRQLALREGDIRYPMPQESLPSKVAEPHVKIEEIENHDGHNIEKDIEDWRAEPPT